MLWRGVRGAGKAVLLLLMLLSALLVATSCSIERVILYNTEMPNPKITASVKIGPT